ERDESLTRGGRGPAEVTGPRRIRDALLVWQLALALVLLAGASLLVRGIRELNDRHYGWAPGNLVTGTLLLRTATYPGDKEITDFQRLALERLEALPGVASASISYAMPFFGLAEPRKLLVAGRET